MNKKNIIGVILIISACLIPSVLSAQYLKVTGKILFAGKGVPSVQVTDGKNFVKTDNQGRYSMLVNSESNFIYYTLPSGYQSPVKEGVPVFYAPLNHNKSAQTVNFELLKSPESQQKHAFILWADPQVADLEEFNLLKEVVGDISKTIASFPASVPFHAISAGDNVFDKLHFYPNYKEVIKELNIPFYQALGNHDMDYNERSNELSDASYSKAFGPAYYSFNKGNVHYVVLKNVFYYGFSYRYIGYVDEKQLSWLEKDLHAVKPGTTVVVTMHIPTIYGESEKPYDYAYQLSNEVTNRKALYKILKPYNAHILAGHSHTQWNAVISPTLVEHVHAAASGAWWQGDICTDGTPKGYTVYMVDGDSLSWYFKASGQDKTEQFKLYSTGSDLKYPEFFIANVYNYDPSWQVSWYENGVYKGEMTRYWGKDPLAESTYIPGKNKKYAWLNVGEIQHLFKAKPEKMESKIQVVVKDRFGNTYKKEFTNTIQRKKTEAGEWTLVWNDEFDYTGLPDDKKWNYDTDGNSWGWGNNEAQHYTAKDSSNAWVNNGILTITAREQKVGDKKYTSARLTTKDKGDWLYGRFEIRAKLPTGRGTWPAIWMLPTDLAYGKWPASGEIDIMENVGYNPDTIFGSAHTKTYNHIIGTQKTKGIYFPTSYSQFHVYALEWEKDEYRLYVDNTLYFTFKNEKTGYAEWPFDKRFYLILNLAVGGNWGGMHGIGDNVFPGKFLIDYVRVYKLK